MKKLTVLLASLGIATAAFPVASMAAPFGVPANAPYQRSAAIEMRIDQGIRSGALDRNEAFRLKAQLRQINYLQAQYQRSGYGLDRRERADLDHRYDALSAKVKFQKHDDARGHGRDHRW